MDPVLAWMESTTISKFILQSSWAFPALETLHFIGLILLIGSIYVVDLRLLGVGRRMAMSAILPLVPVSILGFGLNLLTGILFLFADPFRYYPNTAFRIKMLLILLAGLNALWFKYYLERILVSESFQEPFKSAQWVGGISLVLWTWVIVLGRWMPYVE